MQAQITSDMHVTQYNFAADHQVCQPTGDFISIKHVHAHHERCSVQVHWAQAPNNLSSPVNLLNLVTVRPIDKSIAGN